MNNMYKPRGLKVDNGVAFLNGYKVSDLALKYQTPLYVLDKEELDYNFKTYQKSFIGHNFKSHIVYASKALLLPKLVKMCTKYNYYIDSVSLGDLYIINQSGFDMTHVIFHGNNKSREELEYAVKNKVCIVVDNLQELQTLKTIVNDNINIMIRINPNIDAHTHEYIKTAKLESKFGVNIEDKTMIDRMLQEVITCKDIKLLGFHSHIGSSIKEIKPFIEEAKKMIDFTNLINDEYHLNLTSLNLGGGFGIDYDENDHSEKVEDMLKDLSLFIDKEIKESNSLINNLYIEPGRSIVGRAGITLYTISQVKTNITGKNYLFIDGGMTDNIRPALYQATYECDIANKMNNDKDLCVDIVGKCCESGDIIRKDVMIAHPVIGDTLITYVTGAYNYSMFSNYNSMLKPAVILVGDDIEVVSRRETLEDLMKLF